MARVLARLIDSRCRAGGTASTTSVRGGEHTGNEPATRVSSPAIPSSSAGLAAPCRRAEIADRFGAGTLQGAARSSNGSIYADFSDGPPLCGVLFMTLSRPGRSRRTTGAGDGQRPWPCRRGPATAVWRRIARSMISPLGETRGSSSVETHSRPHRLRLFGQCLPGLCLEVPPGHRDRHQRRRIEHVRPALDHGRGRPGKSFRFTSQNFVNDKLDTAIDGTGRARGRRQLSPCRSTSRPRRRSSCRTASSSRRARPRRSSSRPRRANRSSNRKIYDGSDGGKKVYATLAVIGRRIGDRQAARRAPPSAARSSTASTAGP